MLERRSSIRLYRIFKQVYDPLRVPSGGLRLGRFDDPFGEFGVLYASSSPETARAEALAPMVPSIPQYLLETIETEWAERGHMRPGLVPRSWYEER